MKRSLLTLAALFLSSAASATSLHPCTPTVRARDSYIDCSIQAKDGSRTYVSITIQTLMSRNLEMCSGRNHVESHTAQVEIRNNDSDLIAKIEIPQDEFSYKLDALDAAFTSKKHGLKLRGCATPLDGGISISN